MPEAAPPAPPVTTAATAATAPERDRGEGGLHEVLWRSGLLNVGSIARRQLGTYFLSPAAYVVGALLIVPVAQIAFLTPIRFQQVTSMAGVYQWVVYLMVFFMPLFTMGLLAEERRSGTLELLLTSPVRDWEVVVGKWLGAFAFFVAVTAFTWIFVVLLTVYQPTHTPVSLLGIQVDLGSQDFGAVFTGYLGLLLVGATLSAIGLLCSALTSNQIVAAFAAVISLVALFYLFGLAANSKPPLSDIFGYLAMSNHTQDFNSGQLFLSDAVYFASVTALALFLATRILESRRWR